MTDQRLRMEKIEELLREIERHSDPATRARSQELMRLVLDLHRDALQRVVGALAGGLDRFAGDEVVSSVLLLHGLHPQPLEARVRSALEKVRPLLGAHGGSVRLAGITDGAVRLELLGSCDGCPSSEATLHHAVESAILAEAPDIVSIELAKKSAEQDRDSVSHTPFVTPAKAGVQGYDRTSEFLGSRFRGNDESNESAACDLCRRPIGEPHSHLVELTTRKLLCGCGDCARLFPERPGARFRNVPERARAVPGLDLSDGRWESLGVPVGTACVLKTGGAVVALYPSPAGAVESAVPPEAWVALESACPALASIESEVEALAVHRGKDAAFIIGVDRCYELAGRVRSAWSGISGGPAVGQAVEAFFARLSEEVRLGR